MKKQFLVFVCTAVLVLGVAGSTFAYPYSGEYMFTMDGNDSNTPETTIEAAINTYFSVNSIAHDLVDLDFFAKVDEPDLSNGGLTLTYDSSNLFGTWSIDDGARIHNAFGRPAVGDDKYNAGHAVS